MRSQPSYVTLRRLRYADGVLLVLLGSAAGAWLAGPTGRLAVVFVVLLFGPGYLVERLVRIDASPALFVRPAIWLGLSLSIVALLYEWATAIGLALTLPILALLVCLCGVASVWALWRDLGALEDSPVRLFPPAHLPFFALLLVFALTLWTRFFEIRDLALPLWVDSVHHAVMIRVAAETGMVPYSLRPYLPVDQLPYHWGYHVLIATLMRIADSDLPWTMLWSGQVLNALHALTLAAFAAYAWRRPLAGPFAGLVVGLLSIMPAYYVTWGRYTQLTGLLILPAIAIIWDANLRRPSRHLTVYTALLLAGLSIIHFRILMFVLCLLVAISIIWFAQAERAQLRARILGALGCAALALAAAGPWMWLLVRRALAPAIAQPSLQLGEASSYNNLSDALLWAGDNRMLIAFALAVALWGLFRRVRPALIVIVWAALLVMLANPWLATYVLPAAGGVLVAQGVLGRRPLPVVAGVALLLVNPSLVRLPYLYLIPNDIVAISLFVPIAVMLGGGSALLVDWLMMRFKRPRLVQAVMTVMFVLLAVQGTWKLRDVINPVGIIGTRADVEAIAWVAEHTPPDARFLINSQPWLPGVERGNDGGWWLTPLAARWTSTPPALFTYGAPEDVRAVQERAEAIARLRPGQERELIDLINHNQITYIYLGATPGTLTAEMFADRRIFEPIYQRDGVTILAVRR